MLGQRFVPCGAAPAIVVLAVPKNHRLEYDRPSGVRRYAVINPKKHSADHDVLTDLIVSDTTAAEHLCPSFDIVADANDIVIFIEDVEQHPGPLLKNHSRVIQFWYNIRLCDIQKA